MTAPERFADSQIPLAPRAPSIHDPLRPPNVHRNSRDDVNLSGRRGAMLIPHEPFSKSHRRRMQPDGCCELHGSISLLRPPTAEIRGSDILVIHSTSGLPCMTSRPVSSTQPRSATESAI